MQDAKGTIKPLLDLGLYEQARSMLANAGFYPEERNMKIKGMIGEFSKMQ